MGTVRDVIGGPPIEVDNPAVILVDKNGVPATIGGGNQTVSTTPYFIATNAANGNDIFVICNATGVPQTAYDISARVPLGAVPTALDIPAAGNLSPTASHRSLGTATTGVIKATPGVLFSLCVTNTNASTRWLQLFNRTDAPPAGAAPLEPFPVYAGGYSELNTVLGNNGLPFATGIVWAMSTTQLTYTPATPAETVVIARYS